MDDQTKAEASAFTIHDVESMQNPMPFYERMRGKCPVQHSDQLGGFYFTTDFETTKRVYDDFRIFSSAEGTALPKQPLPLYPIDLDPPIQTKYRKLLNPLFLPEAVEVMKPRIQAVIDELFEGFIDKGEAELQEDLIRPMLSGVVLPFLGIPMSDRPLLHGKLDYLTRHRADDPEGCARIGEELGAYLIAHTNKRRASEPRDDILQIIIDTEINGAKLTDLEILGVLTLVLFGGLDTTSAALGEGLYHLARHPEDAERLRKGEIPWRQALDEFVRYASPIQGLRRTVACPVNLGGVDLKPGDYIFAMNGAGNRDPQQFDQPDRVDLDRQMEIPHGHLGFGAGAHICIGQHFARGMMELVITSILTRIPDFNVAPDFRPEYAVGESRVMRHLPVTFTPRAAHAAAA